MRIVGKLITFRILCWAAMLLAGVISAAADPVNFNVNGSFGVGSCPTCSVNGFGTNSISSRSGGMTSTIVFTPTVNGVIGPLSPGEPVKVTLGLLQGGSSGGNSGQPSFAGATFTLTINLTVSTKNNPQPVTLTAMLTGHFIQHEGNVQIEFSNPTLTFTTSSGDSFMLMVPSVTEVIKCGSIMGGPMLMGQLIFKPKITPTPPGPTPTPPASPSVTPPIPIPEPATLILLGSGLVGVAGLAARRRRAKKAGRDSK